MIDIQSNAPDLPVVNPELLKMAISATLQKFNRSDVAVTLRLTDDTEMKMLNKTYREESKTTDVLSFNEDYIDPENRSVLPW